MHEIRRTLALVAYCFLAALPGYAASGGKNLRLVTQNMYEGTNFRELAAARTEAEFAQAVTTTYLAIQSTNPAERAAAMAREIAGARPHFVALQEASILRTGATAPANAFQSDLLQRLIAELARKGQHYAVVSVLAGLDTPPVPSTLGFDVRLTSQDALLARSDLPASEFSFSNVQAQHYRATLSFPSAIGPIPFPRGFISLDARVNGHAFRLVTTHLEIDPQVNAAQAAELAELEGASPLPVVIAGDVNAVAAAFTTAGFGDAWTIAHPQDAGFTCCQPGDLRNVAPALTQRIDFVLMKGGFGVEGIDRIGIRTADRTASGLWPSDHAGLAAVLTIP